MDPSEANDPQPMPPAATAGDAPGHGGGTTIAVGRSVLAPHAHGRGSRRPRQAARVAHDAGRATVRTTGTGGAPDEVETPDNTSSESFTAMPTERPMAIGFPVNPAPPPSSVEAVASPTVEFDRNEIPAPWEHADDGPSVPMRPRRKWLRNGLFVISLALIAALIGFGLRRFSLANETNAPPTAPDTTAATSSTSSIPSVAALQPLAAAVRILAGGPDAMGNGGNVDRVLLRRPTSVARVRAGLVVADAGSLRLIRPDGRSEGVEVDNLADNVLIDHLAALTNGRILAVDASTNRFFVIDGVGSSVVRASAAKGGDIVFPAYAVSDDDGGALIADPGSGAVWRWSPDAPPVRLLGGLVAPIHVAPLPGGAAVVTDRGSGQVLRIDAANQATVIASNASVDTPLADRGPSDGASLRSTPIAAVAVDTTGVHILMLDGSIARVARVPQVNDRAGVVTEFLSGATSLLADGGATLIIESGERRIRSITAVGPGRSNLPTVLGDTRWPRFTPVALRTKDVVLIDPTGVAVRTDGSVVVADRGANMIWLLSEDGSAQRLAGTGAWGNSADNPNGNESSVASPTDIAVRADGTVVFTEPTFGRIRGVAANGSLITLTKKAEVDSGADDVPPSNRDAAGQQVPPPSPGQPLFSPGPLAFDGRGALIVGDRYLGGLWSVTPSGSVRVTGAGLATRFVFSSSEPTGAVVAMDAVGKAVRVSEGSVVAGAEGLVAEGEVVRGGSSDGTNLEVAVSSDGVGQGDGPRSSADFSVVRRAATSDSRGARIVAMTAFEGSLIAVTNGVRGAVVRLGGEADLPLTSTALGEDSGRANETNLSDPVALDVGSDDTLIVTDRGGGRVRALRAGQLTTLAGNGTVDRRNDPKANAFGQSLSDLRGAHANRSGTISVIDGSRLLTIDGTGLVLDRRVADLTGEDLVLRSIDQGPDGATLAVADDGRLFRIDNDGATVLTTAPALSNVRVEDNGTIWGVTNTGRVVQLDGDRFVNVETPRDLAVIACDERDGRLVIVGRDGTVALRMNGEWFRMSPSTTVTADRRTNRAANPRPTDVAILRDGGVVVADAGRDALLVYRVS